MKNSSQVVEEILDEVAEEYKDEGITREEIRDFFVGTFGEYKKAFSGDEFPMIGIPKLGTFMPVPSRVEDKIIKAEEQLKFLEPGSKAYVKKEKQLESYKSEHKRVKKLMKNYNKK